MIASLEAKTALVTGAGRGIGRAIALELASAGLAVALVARSEDQLADTAQQVKELGSTAVVVPAVLAAMLERGWGRIVNVSSAIAGQPGAMVGMNAYAASKAALEAHTVNLAAELAHSGVTVNAFRPGSVDTAMQAGLRAQDPARIGTDLHEWFARSYAEGDMITPQQSARSLVPRLSADTTGQIWEASTPI